MYLQEMFHSAKKEKTEVKKKLKDISPIDTMEEKTW